VSTSDEPALMRPPGGLPDPDDRGVFARSRKDVLVLMDFVTRFAMAQREIGLSAVRAADGQGVHAHRFHGAAAPA
jgi:flagellar biosynthesis/type III secretory pathway ATPase